MADIKIPEEGKENNIGAIQIDGENGKSSILFTPKDCEAELPNGKKVRIEIDLNTKEKEAARAAWDKLKASQGQGKPLKEVLTEKEASDLLDYYFIYASKEEKEALGPITESLMGMVSNYYKFSKLQSVANSMDMVFNNPNNDFYSALLDMMQAHTGKIESSMEEISSFVSEAVNLVLERTNKLFDSNSPWVELTKIVAELKDSLDKTIQNDPFISAFYDEVAKMRSEEAWKDVDLSYYTFDAPGENGCDVDTPSRHNHAIAEAYRRAEERVKREEEEAAQQPELFDLETTEGQEDKEPLKEEDYESGRKINKQIQVVSKLQWAMVMTRIINAGTLNIPMTGKGKTIKTRVSVSIPTEANVKGVENLSGYEWEVSNGLYTLWVNGFKSFTIRKLYQAIVMDETALPTEAKEEELKKILEKFSFLKVSIDASEEIQKYTKDPKAKYIRNDNYFHLRSEVVSLYGQEVLMYYFVGQEAPILLDHAQRTNKLASFGKNLLNVKDEKGHNLNNTDARTAITGHLLRRIRQMKDPNTGEIKAKQNRRIDFKGLFADLQIPIENREKERRYRENIFKILDHLEREGEIKSYKIVKGGRGGAVQGVDIFF